MSVDKHTCSILSTRRRPYRGHQQTTEKWMDHRSISPVRLADLTGPRRSKPPVRKIRRTQADAIEKERVIVQDLLLLSSAEN